MKENSFVNKNNFLILIGLLVSLVWSYPANAQEPDENKQKNTEIRDLIQSKNFAFVAQNAAPLGGRTINLTSIYDVRLSSDTIVSNLPYFGRTFVAPMNPSEGGINFTSTKFNYTINPKKKGGWEVNISPKDARDVRQMFMTVSEKGYASLQVTSNNRQPINFSGYITSREKLR